MCYELRTSLNLFCSVNIKSCIDNIVSAAHHMMSLNRKQTFVSVLSMVVLASLVLVPTTKAIGITYNDSYFNYLSVSSNEDVTKPGNFTTVTITGKLLVNQSAVFEVRFYVDTTAQQATTIGSTYLVLPVNYGVGTVIYPILIPTGALNNTYVYATISNGTTIFSKIPVTLVQNPTYSELQVQLSQLQSSVSSLNAQVSSLQNQISTLQVSNANLQNQIISLTNEKVALQVQVNSLQSNVSSLNAQLSSLQTQLNALNANNTSLQNQIASLTNEKAALQAQISNLLGNNSALQEQLGSLNASSLALQSQVNSLQTEKSNLQTQTNELQANNTNLESQVVSLQSNKETLQTLVNTLELNNTELLNQANDLQAQISNLQLNCTNLQVLVDTFSLQIASLELQVSDLDSQNNTNSLLMYTAMGVAVTFIAVTGCFIFKKLKKNPDAEDAMLY